MPSISDDFERSSGAIATGSSVTWVNLASSTWQTNGSGAGGKSATDSVNQSCKADHDLTTDHSITVGISGGPIMFSARLVDNDNRYEAFYDGSDVYLFKWVSGSRSTIGGPVGVGGGKTSAKLKCVGSTISVEVNAGTEVISVTDTSLTAGTRVGLSNYYANYNYTTFAATSEGIAPFTAIQSGDWTDTDVWVSGNIPGDGDDCYIPSGITVNVDDNITVGSSPDTTAAYGASRDFDADPAAIKLAGAMTFTAGRTLTCKGDIDSPTNTAKAVTLGAACAIRFDCQDAGTPASTRYGMNNVALTINGTSGAGRSTIDFNYGESGINGRFTGNAANCCSINSTYGYLDNAGESTDGYGIQLRPAAGVTTRFLNTQIRDGAGPTTTDGIAATSPFILDAFTIKGSLRSSAWVNFIVAAPSGGAARTWNNVVMDKGIEALANTGGFDMDTTIMLGFINVAEGTNELTSVANWFLRPDTGNDYTIPTADFSDSYFYYNDHGHMLTPEIGIDSDIEFSGLIFDTSDDVDTLRICILTPTPPGRTLNIRNCIVCPTESGYPTGVLAACTQLSDSDTEFALYHCTARGGTNGGLVVIDDYDHTGHAGMIPAVKSCIAYNPGSAAGYKIADTGSNDSVSDLIASADADYNCGYGLATGSNSKGYNNLEFSSGSPGAHDIDEDPAFVDAARNLKTWDASIAGGGGSASHAMAELAKLNDDDWDSDYSVQNLLAYIRAGYAPTNINLKDSGHDSVTIGAAEGQFSTGRRRRILLRG